VDLREYNQVYECQVVVAASKLETILARSRSARPSYNPAQALFRLRGHTRRGHRVPGERRRRRVTSQCRLSFLVPAPSPISRQTSISCSTLVFPSTSTFTSPHPCPRRCSSYSAGQETIRLLTHIYSSHTRESWPDATSDAGVDAARVRTTLPPGSSSYRSLARARTLASAPMLHRPCLCVPRALLPPNPASFSSTPVERQVLCESVERARLHCLKWASEWTGRGVVQWCE
jgi:hypothetical protein